MSKNVHDLLPNPATIDPAEELFRPFLPLLLLQKIFGISSRARYAVLRLLLTVWSCVSLASLLWCGVNFFPKSWELSTNLMILLSGEVNVVLSLINFVVLHRFDHRFFTEFKSALAKSTLAREVATTRWISHHVYAWSITVVMIILMLAKTVSFVLTLLPLTLSAYKITLFILQFGARLYLFGPFIGVSVQNATMLITTKLYHRLLQIIRDINWDESSINRIKAGVNEVLDLTALLNSTWSEHNIAFSLMTAMVGTLMTGVAVRLISNDYSTALGMVSSIMLFVGLFLLSNIPVLRLNEARSEISNALVKKCLKDKWEQSEAGITLGNDGNRKSACFLLELVKYDQTYITAGNCYIVTRETVLTTISVMLSYVILLLQFVEFQPENLLMSSLANTTMIR